MKDLFLIYLPLALVLGFVTGEIIGPLLFPNKNKKG